MGFCSKKKFPQFGVLFFGFGKTYPRLGFCTKIKKKIWIPAPYKRKGIFFENPENQNRGLPPPPPFLGWKFKKNPRDGFPFFVKTKINSKKNMVICLIPMTCKWKWGPSFFPVLGEFHKRKKETNEFRSPKKKIIKIFYNVIADQERFFLENGGWVNLNFLPNKWGPPPPSIVFCGLLLCVKYFSFQWKLLYPHSVF